MPQDPAGTTISTAITSIIAGNNVDFSEINGADTIQINSTAQGFAGGTVVNVVPTNGLELVSGSQNFNPQIGIADIPGLTTGTSFPNATLAVNSRGQVTEISAGIVETGTTAVFANTAARNAATDTYNGYVALIADEDNTSYIFTGTRTLADVTTTPAVSTDDDWTLLSNPAIALTQAQGDQRYALRFGQNNFSSINNFSAEVNLNGTTSIVDANVTELDVYRSELLCRTQLYRR